MSVIHDSPSGPEVTFETKVTSLFGRTGAVVAVLGDYDTDEIDNASSVSGASFTDALLELSNSNSEANTSDVPGATVSDALDYLGSHPFVYLPGLVHDTFSGGSTTNTVASSNANVGDFGWNVASSGSPTGASVNKISAVGTSTVGVYRCASPSSSVSGQDGFTCFLGSPTAHQGPVRWDQLAECAWRARFDPDTPTFNVSCAIGLCDQPGGIQSVEFNVTLHGGIGTGPNYQVAVSPPVGLIFIEATTIPVDHLFHDFRIVRVSATQADFYIDGVLVVSVTDTDALPSASDVLLPFFRAITGTNGVQTPSFVDVDDFKITPVAA
jgi:hypothetical protein